jgi:hypothetical protein
LTAFPEFVSWTALCEFDVVMGGSVLVKAEIIAMIFTVASAAAASVMSWRPRPVQPPAAHGDLAILVDVDNLGRKHVDTATLASVSARRNNNSCDPQNKKETGLSETIQRRQGKETRDTYYMIMGNKHSSV